VTSSDDVKVCVFIGWRKCVCLYRITLRCVSLSDDVKVCVFIGLRKCVWVSSSDDIKVCDSISWCKGVCLHQTKQNTFLYNLPASRSSANVSFSLIQAQFGDTEDGGSTVCRNDCTNLAYPSIMCFATITPKTTPTLPSCWCTVPFMERGVHSLITKGKCSLFVLTVGACLSNWQLRQQHRQ